MLRCKDRVGKKTTMHAWLEPRQYSGTMGLMVDLGRLVRAQLLAVFRLWVLGLGVLD